MENALLEIKFELFDREAHWTAMEFCVHGENILRYIYKNEECSRTSTGVLDILMEYLEETLSFAESDTPFPISVQGNNASEMYHEACKFDSDDFDTFEAYYSILQDWGFKHSWMHARNIFFIADVMICKVNDGMEISWDNRHLFEDDGVDYLSKSGCVIIPAEQYKKIIRTAIEDYHRLWA